MIIDSLKNSAIYEGINPYFKEAFDYLKKMDFNNLTASKTKVNGDALIVNISETQLKTKENARLEIHDKYIDIQIPVSGPETFGWKERDLCNDVTVPFNTEKDIEYYGDIPSTLFTLLPGEFVIFFPEDAHAPLIGEGPITKIIVKVLA